MYRLSSGCNRRSVMNKGISLSISLKVSMILSLLREGAGGTRLEEALLQLPVQAEASGVGVHPVEHCPSHRPRMKPLCGLVAVAWRPPFRSPLTRRQPRRPGGRASGQQDPGPRRVRCCALTLGVSTATGQWVEGHSSRKAGPTSD